MGLIQAAPERVAAAILFQTIGLDGDRQLFYDMFDGWADELKPSRPEVSEETWVSFRKGVIAPFPSPYAASRLFCRHLAVSSWATGIGLDAKYL